MDDKFSESVASAAKKLAYVDEQTTIDMLVVEGHTPDMAFFLVCAAKVWTKDHAR